MVYVAAYELRGRRTNTYLSEVEQAALEQAALDALGDLAAELAEEARRLTAADPDLRSD